MRSALNTGRVCLRQLPRTRLALPCPFRSAPCRPYSGGGGGKWYKKPPRHNGIVYTAAAVLSPAVFVSLSEKDNDGTEQTAEGRMLEASRDEIRKKVGDDVHGLRRFGQSILLVLDVYIWEPLCTGLRFLHLFVVFVPVIITVPAVWIGPRQKNRDNERSGALWWYWFLVKAMEQAGPAFIKVKINAKRHWTYLMLTYSSLDNGQHHGQTSFPRRCAKSCPHYIQMHQHTPSQLPNVSFPELLKADNSRRFLRSSMKSPWELEQ